MAIQKAKVKAVGEIYKFLARHPGITFDMLFKSRKMSSKDKATITAFRKRLLKKYGKDVVDSL